MTKVEHEATSPPERERTAEPGSRPAQSRSLLARHVAERALRQFFRDRGTHLAASIAFRVLFSLFPLALVLGAVFGVVSAAAGFQPDVIDAIVRNAPLDADGKRGLRRVLREAAESSAVGIVGAVGLVWAATGMMTAVRTALNLAWDVEDQRPWLIGKVLDVLLVFGTSLVVMASLALNVTVRVARELLDELDIGIGIGAAHALAGLVAPFLLTFLVVVVLYRVVPAVSPRLSDLIAPALLVAAVLAAAQVAFAWYLESFGRYSVVYGSIGAIVAFMFFVYLAALVFLFGAQVAAASPHVRAELRRGDLPRDEGRRSLAETVRERLRALVVRPRR